MYLSPQKAIEQGWISGVPEENIQPNGIDFTADRMFFAGSETFILSAGDFKRHRTYAEMKPSQYVTATPDGQLKFECFRLAAQTSYDVLSNITVNVPQGVAAFLIGRSTLNRNSMFLTSGLYDSGFVGNIGCQLHNMMGPAVIEKGTRIGQFVFVEAQAARTYNGQYNNLSTHWASPSI